MPASITRAATAPNAPYKTFMRVISVMSVDATLLERDVAALLVPDVRIRWGPSQSGSVGWSVSLDDQRGHLVTSTHYPGVSCSYD